MKCTHDMFSKIAGYTILYSLHVLYTRKRQNIIQSNYIISILLTMIYVLSIDIERAVPDLTLVESGVDGAKALTADANAATSRVATFIILLLIVL